MVEFVFDEEMIIKALEANGYHEWGSDNWIIPSVEKPEYSGITIEEAFSHLLRKSNLI